MRKINIIINGSGASGKDTAVDIIKTNTLWEVINISSIDMIREAAKLLGWDGRKEERDREFLHKMKLLAGWYCNHSTQYMLDQYSKIKYISNDTITFFHIREPDEIRTFKRTLELDGAEVLTLLIKRDTLQTFGNDADKYVDKYEYDYVIENNGTLKEFEAKLFEFLSINEVHE